MLFYVDFYVPLFYNYHISIYEFKGRQITELSMLYRRNTLNGWKWYRMSTRSRNRSAT